jgi:hypothetical protein
VTEEENKKVTKKGGKLSTNMASESECMMNVEIVKLKTYDVSTTNLNNNYDTFNIINKEENFFVPKSFIEVRNPDHFPEQLVLSKDYSMSCIDQNMNTNLIHQNYLSNLKIHEETKKSNIVADGENSETNNFTFKLDKNADINNSLFINGEDANGYFEVSNSRNNAENGFKHFNGEKVLLKHTLRKNKTPKFFLASKKYVSCQKMHSKFLENSNIEEKNSFISINKETINKYQYLFSDVENISSKSNRGYSMRFNNSKNISHPDDGDLTNLQRFVTVYSTTKTNSSNVLVTEGDSKVMNTGTAKGMGMINELQIKDVKL